MAPEWLLNFDRTIVSELSDEVCLEDRSLAKISVFCSVDPFVVSFLYSALFRCVEILKRSKSRRFVIVCGNDINIL